MHYSQTTRIIVRPDCDELSQMMRSQDGAVPGQVVKVVHDDGNKQVEHDEGTEEDEGDEVDVGHVGTTGLIWHENFTWNDGTEKGASVRLTTKTSYSYCMLCASTYPI